MNHVLSVLLALPLLSGLVLLALPQRLEKTGKSAALTVSVIQILAALLLWLNCPLNQLYALETRLPWLTKLGLEYHLGVDGLSLFLVILTVFFIPIALLMAPAQMNQSAKFAGLLLLMEAGLLGTLLSLNLFLFYVFWELMLIPAFFLIGIWGGANRVRAVTKFVIYTMAGSLIFLFSILYLGSQYYARSGHWSFALTDLLQLSLSPSLTTLLLFLGFSLAFFIKVPLFPLHTWLPDTYTEAPTVVTFLLSGLMAKMGVYGLIRITMPLFPETLNNISPILVFLAVIGLLYGAIVALGQRDLKRLVAYSSFSHLSLIVMGVFIWNGAALEGSIFHMINHALSTGALFLLVARIEACYGTTEIDKLGGLAHHAPLFAFCFLVMSFASIGVPGLNGFVGEFTILLGVVMAQPILGALAALTLIFSAAYMLRLVQSLIFGPENDPPTSPLLPPLSQVLLAPFVILVFGLGLYTTPIMRHVSPAAKILVDRYQENLSDPARAVQGLPEIRYVPAQTTLKVGGKTK